MLKSVFLIAILILLTLENFGQQRLGIGIAGRIGNSWASFPMGQLQFNKRVPETAFGLAVYHMSTKHFGLQAEINYANKGYKIGKEYSSFGLPDSGWTYSRSINYIEIPLLTHVEIGKGRFHIIANLGPQFSYAISSSETFNQNVTSFTGIKTGDIYISNTKTNGFQFGLAVGGGINYRFNFGIIQLEARYYLGLSNIIPPRKYSNFQNQHFGATISYYYLVPIRKKEKEATETP